MPDQCEGAAVSDCEIIKQASAKLREVVKAFENRWAIDWGECEQIATQLDSITNRESPLPSSLISEEQIKGLARERLAVLGPFTKDLEIVLEIYVTGFKDAIERGFVSTESPSKCLRDDDWNWENQTATISPEDLRRMLDEPTDLDPDIVRKHIPELQDQDTETATSGSSLQTGSVSDDVAKFKEVLAWKTKAIKAEARIKELEAKLAEHEAQGLAAYGTKVILLNKRIAELEQDCELYSRAINLEQRQSDAKSKRIAELEQENARLKLELEAKGQGNGST